MKAQRAFAFFAAVLALFLGRPAAAADAPAKARVLILSGQNNHDWRKTTPALRRIRLLPIVSRETLEKGRQVLV